MTPKSDPPTVGYRLMTKEIDGMADVIVSPLPHYYLRYRRQSDKPFASNHDYFVDALWSWYRDDHGSLEIDFIERTIMTPLALCGIGVLATAAM